MVECPKCASRDHPRRVELPNPDWRKFPRQLRLGAACSITPSFGAFCATPQCRSSPLSSGSACSVVLVGVFGWPAVWANVVATAIALAPSFELSRRWVWAHDGRRSIPRQAAPYAAISFAGLIVSSFAVHLAANATSSSTRLVHTVAVLLANVAAYGSLWIVQFVVCDRILFPSRARAGRDSNGAVSDGDGARAPVGSPLAREVLV